MKKYFLVLDAEDGEYILDEFFNIDDAYDAFDKLKDNYGEGQTLYIR